MNRRTFVLGVVSAIQLIACNLVSNPNNFQVREFDQEGWFATPDETRLLISIAGSKT